MKTLYTFFFVSLLLYSASNVLGQKKSDQQDPFQHPFANPVDNPLLPNVLIIGDSISVAYTPPVRKLLNGKANVYRPKTNCRWSAFGAENIDEWIGDSQWDVIHFNFGLWDWYGWRQESKASPESYADSLDKIVSRLKKTNAKLIFASTTPPCVGPEAKVKIVISEERAKEFNDAAVAAMKKHGVQVNDLYSAIGSERSSYQQAENDVHYNQAGNELLAAQVATTIEAVLPDAPDREPSDAPLPKTAAKTPSKVLPNVLILGDSISIGYTPMVVEQLQETVNVVRPKANCGDTNRYLSSLSKWLGDTKWDVIHFNVGLHDLCYRHPKSKVQGRRDKANGTIAVPLEEYEKNLGQIVNQLKATSAKLIWASTTLVPDGEAGRRVGDDVKYNAVASKIMERHGIPTNDLHKLSSEFPAELFKKPGDVHFQTAGSKKLADQVVSSIKNELSADSQSADSQTSTNSDRPNIIFILADDWGLGDVKAYGGDRCKIDTPNMVRLAQQGMKFTDAHSSSSVCTPTRYGVLTGRYNWRSQLKKGVLQGFSQPLIEPDRETVPAFLKKASYHTAMIGKWHLGMNFPTNDEKPARSTAKKPEQLATHCNVDWKGQITGGPNSIGFDYYWGISASLDMPPYIWIENDRFVGECTTIKAFQRPGPAHADFEDYDVLPTLTKKATDYVREQAQTPDPFFLYMPLNSPHTPISPSKKWQGKSKLGPYGDFVMETDWSIGEVIKAVDDAGIADNTLIIVTADNGCSPASKRGDPNDMIRFRMGDNEPADPTKHYASDIYRGHKADIYDGGHRVPYIARWNGKVRANSVCSDSVCLVDLFATCADIVGQKIPEAAAVDSFSLLPILLGHSDKPAREAVVHHSINGSFSIRQGKWKLALCPGSGGWSDPRPGRAQFNGQPKVQLYDLDNDIAETTNVESKHLEVVKELTGLLESYVKQGRSTPGMAQPNNGAIEIHRKVALPKNKKPNGKNANGKAEAIKN